MTFAHDEIVIYTGRTDRDYHVEHGKEYRVFGGYPAIPIKGREAREELSIRVPDEKDEFGGVVSLPVSWFAKAQGAT